MKGKILLAAAALIVSKGVRAQQRSLDEVISIANTYYNNIGSDAAQTRTDEALELFGDFGSNLSVLCHYVFSFIK